MVNGLILGYAAGPSSGDRGNKFRPNELTFDQPLWLGAFHPQPMPPTMTKACG
jgi:hypothetical protein